MNEKESAKGLRTVQRSIDILNCFTLYSNELTLTEIAKNIGLAKSTTSRLLATLEQNNFVEKNPTNLKYQLGKKLYFIGQIAEKSLEIKEIAQPIMRMLRDETNETVTLYLIEKQYRVCVQRYSSLQSIQHIVNIGEHLSLTKGAAGKVLLAYQTPSFIKSIFENEISEGNRKQLEEDLLTIKEQGHSVSIDERGIGVIGVAAPIFDFQNQVNYCIGISGPRARFTQSVINNLKNKVKDEALKISIELGYIP